MLLVLTVNHRALPAYAHVAPAKQTEVKHLGRDADTSVLKQKVSFEATNSAADIQLAEPAAFLPLTFVAPAPQVVKLPLGVPYWTFFLQLQATQPISPNAP
ncbi:hypothetical protein TH63_02245 [Rufibacter radiotolerans]|uniref:Uncharacterized protein n=1 Tax=Rufibacter radiotolerans TaxID=1379910 RepID=A0A0H4VLC5_9BACT|nr:hypothetical protein TH63_02245 [Rufibacter radiotolerans]